MGSKRVQRQGTKFSQKGLDMPPYMTLRNHTYYFRQSVPPELRPLIGKREIKKSLGRNYPAAVSLCKKLAVEADKAICDARAQFDSIPVDPFSSEGIRRTRPVPLTEVTPELETQFGNLIRNALLETDRNKRIAGMDAEEFAEYGRHIDQSIAALRKQLAMGNVTPVLEDSRILLIGRGYNPNFSEEGWRKIAYTLTQAFLEAYEGIKKRQEGAVVTETSTDTLPSQFIVQNTRKTTPDAGSEITWQMLYDVWEKECERRQSTKDAYLAAMKLFAEFSRKAPPQTTRDDALAFRDFLRDVKSLSPGTIANKLGFIGTLFNAGRNTARLASHLPENPFADITVKRAKRGSGDNKRLPFSDNDLKIIFSSPIYTQGERPEGGAGEACVWVPAIAYLTGMRLEEIATLTRSQFRTDAKGNHYIHVLASKTDGGANRDVPIHPELIKAGLLNYVSLCTDRLFPQIQSTDESQSSAFSKWFGRFLDNLQIKERSKVFHSFRHLFKDICRNARIEEAVIDQICGHEPGTVGGKYGRGRRVDVLATELQRVTPPISLPMITPSK